MAWRGICCIAASAVAWRVFLIELVLIACLTNEPKSCEQFYLPPIETTSISGCVVLSQFHVIRWLDEHPDWSARSWKCEITAA
jgi:hypothetical protein